MPARAKTTRVNGDTVRLESQDWIDAALDLLAEGGIDAVRVEPLAKRLEITKGSFYWHFKDRRALQNAILDHWRRRATLQIIERLEKQAGDARSRLTQLLRLPIEGQRSGRGVGVDLAIRLWGRRDPGARAALEEVDQLRLRYIEGLLQEAGLDPDTAAVRAVFAYSFLRVAGTLIDTKDNARLQACIDYLLDRTGPSASPGES